MNKNKINIDFNKSGKTGFSIPKNYFNDLDEQIASAKSLSKVNSKNPYKTPNNYFSNIEHNIFSAIKTEQKNETKIVRLYKKTVKLIPMSAAAIVLLLLTLNYFANPTDDFNNITVVDIEAWYNEGYEVAYNDELALALNSSDLKSEDLNLINSDDLEDYLHNIDNSLLVNEIE